MKDELREVLDSLAKNFFCTTIHACSYCLDDVRPGDPEMVFRTASYTAESRRRNEIQAVEP